MATPDAARLPGVAIADFLARDHNVMGLLFMVMVWGLWFNGWVLVTVMS